MLKIEIEVTGMKCEHCEKRVNEVLKESFKAKSIKVDRTINKATIITPNDISDDDIKKAISQTNFQVGNITRAEAVRHGLSWK